MEVGVSFTGDSERYVKEGSGNGGSLSIKGTWRVGSLLGTP
jgi:hypothetical protein